MEDHQIVDLYWQHSSDAIADSDCRTIAYRLLGNHADAEECVNDPWVGARNAVPIHRPACLSAFLGKITRRTACNRLDTLRAEKRGGGELPLVLEELTDCISVRHRQLEDAYDHLSIALIYENKQWLATRVEPDQSGNFPETAFSLYGGQMFLRGNVFANDGKIRDGSHFFLQFNRLSFNFPKKACIF